MVTRIRLSISLAAIVVLLAACGGSGDVVVDGAREAAAGADGGTETIQSPDFEVELEPGQDPDEVLAGPTPTSPPAPDDAIAVLCPSVEAVIAGAATQADLDTIRGATPTEWSDLVADLRAPEGRGTDPQVEALDRWFYDTCSVPLFAAVDQIAAGCDDTACRVERIETELGGLCFDDENPGTNGGGAYRLLSCVSGLPIDG